MSNEIIVPDDKIPPNIPEGFEDELFNRNILFFGEEGFSKIKKSFVIVVGLGGVGSNAAHILARSGVNKLRLIDFDLVTLSSLNRHAIATLEDVGLSKATVLRDKLKQIIPTIDIDARAELLGEKTIEELLSGNPTYVLDCIDNVKTKAELLSFCVKNHIKVISSVGAGLKNDPSRLRIGTLLDAVRDPLAAKLRWRLKKHNIDGEDIQCVFIAASQIGDLCPLTDEQARSLEENSKENYFRVRTVPVLGTIPAIFGNSMSTWVLCEIGGKHFSPATMVSLGRNMRNKLLQKLRRRELKEGADNDFPVDLEDISFLVDYWKGRCAVSGARMIGHEKLELVRWDPIRPLSLDNIVLLTTSMISKIDSKGRDKVVPSDRREYIEEMLDKLKVD